MQRLAAGFSDERERLEGQWDQGDDVSTEDLRVALTRYRSFFDRLLAAQYAATSAGPRSSAASSGSGPVQPPASLTV
jgi:hypothetical protein